ncbi:MAG: HNH endonuclease [Myxococcota bacterium]
MNRAQRLLLWAAATDAAFALEDEALAGPCIHCRRKLAVPLRNPAAATATVEHIVPRHHGGTDDLQNLAVACARCNAGKGVRLDHRRRNDPTLERVIRALQEKREARYREAPEGLALPPRPPAQRGRKRRR